MRTLTITAEEMSRLESLDMKYFEIAGWASYSNFTNDRVLAVPGDFAEAAGWSSALLSAEELEAVGDQISSIEIKIREV